MLGGQAIVQGCWTLMDTQKLRGTGLGTQKGHCADSSTMGEGAVARACGLCGFYACVLQCPIVTHIGYSFQALSHPSGSPSCTMGEGSYTSC